MNITKNIFSVSPEHKTNKSLSTPNVYFRGVNRVQINRFKAYILILSNRLATTWHVTQDIKTANVVVDWDENKESDKRLRMSILAGTANLKPPVIHSFKINFNENELARQLNQASKQLLIANKDADDLNLNQQEVQVCGLLNESLSKICLQLNANATNADFVPSVGIFSTKTNIYKEKLLLIIDPNSPDSVRAYQALMHKKLNGDLIINEFTIAIIYRAGEDVNEEIFDMVYDNADESTHVTLVNFEDDSELLSFVAYF